MEERKMCLFECISRITATNRPRRKWAHENGHMLLAVTCAHFLRGLFVAVIREMHSNKHIFFLPSVKSSLLCTVHNSDDLTDGRKKMVIIVAVPGTL
jgi:hypothetical protein